MDRLAELEKLVENLSRFSLGHGATAETRLKKKE